MRKNSTFTILFILFLAFICFPSENIKVIGDTEVLVVNEKLNYLIITSNEYKSIFEPLKVWKSQTGTLCDIITTETIDSLFEGADLTEKIRNCLIYIHNNSDLQWVLLGGGYSIIPVRYIFINNSYAPYANSVVCDQYYANLDSDWIIETDSVYTLTDYYDWDNELFIGRFTGDNSYELGKLVQRTIAYENNPPPGDWYTKALLTGAFVCFDEDYNNDNLPDFDELDDNRVNNFLVNTRLPDNFQATLLGETEGIVSTSYPYNYSLNEVTTIQEINKGTSFGVLAGHGSPTGIYRLRFVNDVDGDKLFDYDGVAYTSEGIPTSATKIDSFSQNAYLTSSSTGFNTNGKDGFYFLSACDTGNFDQSGSECLASHVLDEFAIGCIASSGPSWAEDWWTERDHGGWYTEGILARLWEQFFIEEITQPGKAFLKAKLDYVVDMNTLGDPPVIYLPKIEHMTLTQFNLLGDPEIILWTNTPNNFTIDQYNQSEFVKLTVRSNSSVVPDANVTLYNDAHYWKGVTDSQGEILLPLFSEDSESVVVTITKQNFIPLQLNVTLLESTSSQTSTDDSTYTSLNENTSESSSISQTSDSQIITTTTITSTTTSPESSSTPWISYWIILIFIIPIIRRNFKKN